MRQVLAVAALLYVVAVCVAVAVVNVAGGEHYQARKIARTPQHGDGRPPTAFIFTSFHRGVRRRKSKVVLQVKVNPAKRKRATDGGSIFSSSSREER